MTDRVYVPPTDDQPARFVTPPNFIDNGFLYLVRCFACGGEHGRENWAMAVASGQCAWCGASGSVAASRAAQEAAWALEDTNDE